LTFVRNIQKEIRSLEIEIKDLKDRILRLDENENIQKDFLINSVNKKKTLVQNLENKIPKDWPKVYKEFQSIIKSEKLTRIKYRRLMDYSYEEINKIYTILKFKHKFSRFRVNFENLSKKLETDDPKKLIKEINLFKRSLTEIPDNRKIVSYLNKVSRSLKKKNIKYDKVRKDFNFAFELYRKKIDKINNIENIIAPQLFDYLENVSNSIAVRQQSKIPRKLALYLAECRADHKDLSLYF
jgi:hypothetical protein